MKEASSNLWSFSPKPNIIFITTNGDINHKGHAVMSRGVAIQAYNRFPGIEINLAQHLRFKGNVPGQIWSAPNKPAIWSFPVRHHWDERASLPLIEASALYIKEFFGELPLTFVLPRPGCGNGHLSWTEVKPVLIPILDDRFTVIELASRFQDDPID